MCGASRELWEVFGWGGGGGGGGVWKKGGGVGLEKGGGGGGWGWKRGEGVFFLGAAENFCLRLTRGGVGLRIVMGWLIGGDLL